MKLTRRGFIGSILALGVAPSIVKADSIMKVITPKYTPGQYTAFMFGEGKAFEVYPYTGNSTSFTIPNHLGWQPQYVLIKRRDAPENWMVLNKNMNLDSFNNAEKYVRMQHGS